LVGLKNFVVLVKPLYPFWQEPTPKGEQLRISIDNKHN